jgi:hypothetical protein
MNFGHGQAQRQVHGNGQQVLRHQHVDAEPFDKFIKPLFQVVPQIMNGLGRFWLRRFLPNICVSMVLFVS